MVSNFLQGGQVGNISTGKHEEARKMIQERWDNIGFTKGLTGYLKENMATLFENEAHVLLKEASDASNSGSFETVVFPLVRRVFSRLLANDIVSVQAMNMPIGKLFFILPVTSERKFEGDAENLDGATASHYGLMGYDRVERNHRSGDTYDGAVRQRYYLPDEVVNIDESGNTPEVVHFFKKSLYDLFYNDGLFDHSKGKVHIRVGGVKPVRIAFNGDYKDVETLPVCGIDDSVRNIIVEVSGFSSFRASKLTGPDGNEMDTESFLASLRVVAKEDIGEAAASGETQFACFKKGEPVHFRCVTQRYGKGLVEYSNPCDAEGKIYLELDLAKPVKVPGTTLDGYIGVASDAISVEFHSSFQTLPCLLRSASFVQHGLLSLHRTSLLSTTSTLRLSLQLSFQSRLLLKSTVKSSVTFVRLPHGSLSGTTTVGDVRVVSQQTTLRRTGTRHS